jgi:hypothetical protein
MNASGGFFVALLVGAARFINHTDPTCAGANVNQAVTSRTLVAATFFRPPDDPCVFCSGLARSPKRNGPSAGEPGPSQSGLPMPRGSACSFSTRRRENRSRHVLVIPPPASTARQASPQNAVVRNPDPAARSATRRGRFDLRLPTAQIRAAVLWRSQSGRRSTRPGARSANRPEAPRRLR